MKFYSLHDLLISMYLIGYKMERLSHLVRYTVIFSYEVLIICRKMEKSETMNQQPTKNV